MELLRWVDDKTKKENASLPFPQLIAYLLEKFNIRSTEGVDNRKSLCPWTRRIWVRWVCPISDPQSLLDPV